MKVVRLQAVPVSVPLTRPFTTALGTARTSEYGIVLVRTDEGRLGVGEIALIWHGNGSRLCEVVNAVLAPALVGLDPFDLVRFRRIAESVLAFGRHSLTAVAAVEMALLDLQGKALGVPVHALLGGLARDSVELSMSLPMGDLDDVLAQARGYLDDGYRTVKVKAGLAAKHDEAVVRSLRAEFGDDLQIRLDLNMAYAQAKDALRFIRRVERYDILSVEQPLSAHDLDGMAYLRSSTDVPIMADESVWSPQDAWQVLRHHAADIVNVYVSESGGPTQMRQVIDMCATASVGVAIGSMPELSIGTAAAAHVAFSASRLDHPSDVAGHLYHAADVAAHDLRIVDGRLLPPSGPGLGVALDWDALDAVRSDHGGDQDMRESC